MRKVKILTDSCADLSAELLERYDIAYAKMSTFLDGRESPALLTWSDAEAHALYEAIRSGKRVTTAQVGVEEFQRCFTADLEQGYDIVYIACASRQSGSVNTGHVTAQRLLADYPGAKIFCIDSLNASIGEGMLAIEAARMAAAGMDAEEINRHILSIRKNVNEFATVHTLEHLKKSGRVSASSAFFGDLMGVKPILIADANGKQTPIKKIRGRQSSLRELVRCMKECIVAPEEQTIYLAHADCSPEEVEQLCALVKEEIPCREIHVGYIGPIIGASVGPDAIGLWAFGQTVSYQTEAQ